MGTIVTLTGPSGAGKTTLGEELRNAGLEPLISTTTRSRRPNETDGSDYFFVSKEEFADMHAKGELIEAVEFHGNNYGVSAQEAKRAFNLGKSAVLVAEPHGAHQIQEYCKERGWNVLSVFINNPLDLLVSRIIGRLSKEIETIKQVSGKSPEEQDAIIQKLIDTNSKRIVSLTTFEQKNWVEPAYQKTNQYDLVFNRFNADNASDVLKITLLAVEYKDRGEPLPAMFNQPIEDEKAALQALQSPIVNKKAKRTP